MSKRTCKKAKNTILICRKQHADLSSRKRRFCRKEHADLSKMAASGTCTFQKTHLMSFSSCIYLEHIQNAPICRKRHSIPHICQKRQLTLPIIVERLPHVRPTSSLRCRNLPRNCRQNPRIGRNQFLHLIVC